MAGVVALSALTGCGNNKNEGDSRERVSTSQIETSSSELEVKETPDSTETPETEESDWISEPVQQVGEEYMLDDEDYMNNLNEYAEQFLQYAALCMEYPESYGGEYLDDSMKQQIVAYTECLGVTSDCIGVDYNEEDGYPFITEDRFAELYYRFFKEESTTAGISLLDEADMYGKDRLAIDYKGNVYACVGDWGLVGPVCQGTTVQVNPNENAMYVRTTIDMYDYEEDKVAYTLGSYTLMLYYSEDDVYDFYIADFTFE